MQQLYKTIHVEMKKALQSRMLKLSLLLGFVFATMSFLYNYDNYKEFLLNIQLYDLPAGDDPAYGMCSLYNSWIGGEPFSLGYLLFFTLMPILAAIPYADSLCTESVSGYSRNVIMKVGWKAYLTAKSCAAFLTGALVIFLPLLYNFILTACVIPAIRPTRIYALKYVNASGTMWSVMFYKHPLIFVILYLLLDLLFGGIFALMSLAVGAFVRRRMIAIAVPYILILALKYLMSFTVYLYPKDICPLSFLHPSDLLIEVDGRIVAAEGIIFAAVSLGMLALRGRKSEIY